MSFCIVFNCIKVLRGNCISAVFIYIHNYIHNRVSRFFTNGSFIEIMWNFKLGLFQADFEIGVWDPELAKGLEDFCLDRGRRDEIKGFEDVDVS